MKQQILHFQTAHIGSYLANLKKYNDRKKKGKEKLKKEKQKRNESIIAIDCLFFLVLSRDFSETPVLQRRTLPIKKDM